MVKLCDPKVLSDGRAESVLDPTMGTGGFLSAYIQYLGNSVDWKNMNNDIAGYDIDEFVMSIGKINLYLQTGQLFERIEHRDTLSNDIGTNTQRLKFKNILANMPFGVKGLTHAGCCKRVRDLGIRGTKSEPLFLQLMMVSLDEGGRCAVVVPDGVLVNSSTCHNGTRKYLLDNFELKRVIKMKGQFFSNTGIQPSILFFENNGKPTSVTEFWEVEKNAAGVITETMIVSVPREKIDTDSYSLDMRRYMEVAVSEKPSAFPMVKLGDIGELCRNNKEIIDNDNGQYIKYFGPKIVGRCVDYQFNGEYILTPSRQSIGLFGYVNEKFNATHTYVIKITNQKILTKYVYYYLFLNSYKLKECSKGIIPYIRNDDILTLTIPHLPLEIQQQIVAELDNIYENAHKASQMAASIKTQMASIMKSVGMRGFERKKIREVMNVVSGKANTDREKTLPIPYYDSNGIIGYVATHLYDGEYTITARNLSIGAVHYINGKFYPSDHTINFTSSDTKIMNNRFFYYWLLNNNKVLKDLSSGVKPGIRKSDVAEILIPIPPLETQQQILTILNTMESERKSLEQMASKAEERAKFVLDGYMN
jgi:restriction endonuclease S subunit